MCWGLLKHYLEKGKQKKTDYSWQSYAVQFFFTFAVYIHTEKQFL